MNAASFAKVGAGARNLMIAAGIGGGILLVLWLIKNREKFDPTSDKNIAYTTASSVVAAVTGVEGDTVGTALQRTFGSDPDYSVDDTAMLKICRVNYARFGKTTVPRCEELIKTYGPG